MNLAPNETLDKLMKMPSQVFTVEELRYLINLGYPYPIGFEKNLDRIYNRVMALEGNLNGRNQEEFD